MTRGVGETPSGRSIAELQEGRISDSPSAADRNSPREPSSNVPLSCNRAATRVTAALPFFAATRIRTFGQSIAYTRYVTRCHIYGIIGVYGPA